MNLTGSNIKIDVADSMHAADHLSIWRICEVEPGTSAYWAPLSPCRTAYFSRLPTTSRDRVRCARRRRPRLARPRKVGLSPGGNITFKVLASICLTPEGRTMNPSIDSPMPVIYHDVDLCVVSGGMAGVRAALMTARHGAESPSCRTALCSAATPRRVPDAHLQRRPAIEYPT